MHYRSMYTCLSAAPVFPPRTDRTLEALTKKNCRGFISKGGPGEGAEFTKRG